MTNNNVKVINNTGTEPFDCKGNLAIIWSALHGYREDCISEADDQWDDIVTAMGGIEAQLDVISTGDSAHE